MYILWFIHVWQQKVLIYNIEISLGFNTHVYLWQNGHKHTPQAHSTPDTYSNKQTCLINNANMKGGQLNKRKLTHLDTYIHAQIYQLIDN